MRNNFFGLSPAMKRAVITTATPMYWGIAICSPSRIMAAPIEISGSTFRMRLACADPVCFVPANKNNCPIVNSKHTAPIPVHPKIV